jgi:putative SOS response-associated peptidase YedK
MSADAQKLKNRYNSDIQDEIEPVYHANGFTNPQMPLITNEMPDIIQHYDWGLIPFWVKNSDQADDIKMKTLNARAETALEKPSFKVSTKKKRCIIPSTGFFEWRHVGKNKYPYFISMKDTELFSFGGIWSEWTNKETGEIKHTFSIITTSANELMSIIHNMKKRMPLILTPENEIKWLENDLSKEELENIMQPLENGLLKAHTIDKRISSPKFHSNIPEITNKVEFEEVKTDLE